MQIADLGNLCLRGVKHRTKVRADDVGDHEELLLGVTLQGSQRFSCHRAVHTSTPGKAILIEPGAVHDGHAPQPSGFTYAMLYIPQRWMSDSLRQRGMGVISLVEAAFRHTLTDDRDLIMAISQAFAAIHHGEGRLACDESLDRLVAHLTPHVAVKPATAMTVPGVALHPSLPAPDTLFYSLSEI